MKTREKYLLGLWAAIIILIFMAYQALTITEDSLEKTIIQICGGIILIAGLILTHRRIYKSNKPPSSLGEVERKKWQKLKN